MTVVAPGPHLEHRLAATHLAEMMGAAQGDTQALEDATAALLVMLEHNCGPQWTIAATVDRARRYRPKKPPAQVDPSLQRKDIAGQVVSERQRTVTDPSWGAKITSYEAGGYRRNRR